MGAGKQDGWLPAPEEEELVQDFWGRRPGAQTSESLGPGFESSADSNSGDQGTGLGSPGLRP